MVCIITLAVFGRTIQIKLEYINNKSIISIININYGFAYQSEETQKAIKDMFSNIDIFTFQYAVKIFKDSVEIIHKIHPHININTNINNLQQNIQRTAFIGNNYRSLGILSNGITNSQEFVELQDSSIRFIKGHLNGLPSKGIIECLSFPANQFKNCKQPLQTWITDCKVVFFIIEEFDTRDELFSNLANIGEIVDNNKICLLFSRNLDTIAMRRILISFYQRFQQFYFIAGQVWQSSQTIKIISDSIISNSLSNVNGLKEFNAITNPNLLNSSGNSIPTISPNITSFTPQSTIVNLEEIHRIRAKEFIQKILKDCNKDISKATHIEEQIYKTSKGLLQEYISTLCHQKILMENQSNSVSESILGKRERAIDNLSIINSSNIKKICYRPEFKWFYKPYNKDPVLQLLSINNDLYPLPQYQQLELENLYRSGKKELEYHLHDYPEKVDINLETKTINCRGIQKKGLERKIFFQEQELTIPEIWRDYQDDIIYSYNLHKTNEQYEIIKEELESSIESSKLTKIIVLQNYQQYSNYCLERDTITINNQKIVDEEFLFYGSYTTPPSMIIDDKNGISCLIPDPDPNLNWGSGIHLSRDLQYVDERAFVIPEKDYITKQIFMVKVAVGEKLNLVYDSSLKRPPERKNINNMPILYDSVIGTYSKNNINTDVNIVYKSSQTYPYFLIEYKIHK